MNMNEQKQNELVLEMTGITKEFPGVKALDNVKFALRQGTVHALMGENGAGKSTLMKCLFGIFLKDAGTIKVSGKEISYKNAKEALENGVSMVHQELNQVRQTRVVDNIWLGRFPMQGIVVDEKQMYDRTKKIFEDLNIDIDPKEKIENLSVSQAQMVEIAKAVSYNAKIVVMDEPTSSLTEKEVHHLFRIINSLKEQGVGIIYISHKMEEILEIADEVTVMRDGKYIATESADDLTTDRIIKLMVGRDLTNRFPEKKNKPSEVILEVKELKSFYAPKVKGVSFELRKGEILGVAGLMGSRRTELLETIFGISKKESGNIYLHGKEVKNNNAREAIKNGFALVTEERRKTGLFAGLSVYFNSIISNIDSYCSGGVINESKSKVDTKWVIDSMRVKTPSEKTKIGTLSGGNQQKVVIGKWLLTNPEILLLDEPTRGIDVGAKYEIYQLINELACNGKGVIVISSEMPELFGITDRIIVMSNGHLAGCVETASTTQEEVLALAAKYI
ncbi:galactose/methyl galactoside ABC transporter ATP-binding protein MglA [Vallitalea guaymasensis]|uniref:Ribose/galactose/methyl galactoside import ATP-binding protein n=1 Tax=Vallitalea guaymasensis TaxID=1185412 RepID=A0A8J8MCY1_9FIRM|nr:galactose/methyl galactoside ABC transporter ATP-binding protein MglA [Vallitalea guaymasensis]